MENLTLEQALRRACETLYAKHGLITPDDVGGMCIRTEGALLAHGFHCGVTIYLNDKDESATISAHCWDGVDETAELTLKWQKSDGTYIARIDTDGDGL